MIDFWQNLIATYVEAARPSSVLLAGGGDGTLLDRLLEATSLWDCIIQVADPAPAFDIGDVRQRAGDRVLIHKADAADVLDLMPVSKLLLLDADPNWYTVHRLLRAASNQATRLAQPFPVTFVTNTAWPYARRDSYADPTAIPEVYRHTHERAGIRPGEAHLCASFGLFADRLNASTENEPRNGVLTAVEDFLASEAPRLGIASIPCMHGISLIYPQDAASGPPLCTILEAMRMGPAALALASAAEMNRLHLAAANADLQREIERARYRNEALHAALREKQLAMAPIRSQGRSATPADLRPQRVKGALVTTRRVAGVSRRVRRALRLAMWAATLQLGARRAEEQERRAVTADIDRLRVSPIMDPAWYSAVYQDVASGNQDPAAHYYYHGAAEGRDPGPYFCTAYYLAHNTDVAQSGMNPLLHYLRSGAYESRDPGPHFSSQFYLDNASDVAQAGHNPLEHFLSCGQAEGRLPLPPV